MRRNAVAVAARVDVRVVAHVAVDPARIRAPAITIIRIVGITAARREPLMKLARIKRSPVSRPNPVRKDPHMEADSNMDAAHHVAKDSSKALHLHVNRKAGMMVGTVDVTTAAAVSSARRSNISRA